MRVTLENNMVSRPEKVKGWFKQPGTINEYVVTLQIELSEEERAILTKHKLWDAVILTKPFYVPPDVLKSSPILRSEVGSPLNFQIKHLLKAEGFKLTFATPVEASNFEAELKNDVLPKLKKYIDASGNAEKPTKQTFDL